MASFTSIILLSTLLLSYNPKCIQPLIKDLIIAVTALISITTLITAIILDVVANEISTDTCFMFVTRLGNLSKFY
jgi:hypothetical protein